jgi:acyl-CoA synthetase (AMP-forming)/AMP-acid ligase II
MIVVTDLEPSRLPRLLEERWTSAESFAVVPHASREWAIEAARRIPTELDRDHFALLSSGSTGAPKLVIGSKERAERLVRTLHSAQENEPVESAVCVLPLTYSFAFVNQWLWSRAHSRRFVPSPGLRSPAALERDLRENEKSMLCLVGIQVPLLLQALGSQVFPEVIRIHFAGGRFPQERLGDLAGLFPNAAIYNNYGCVEAMPRLTLRRADEGSHAPDVGKALPGVVLRVDQDGRLLFRSDYGAVAWVEDAGVHRVGPQEWVPSGDLASPGENGAWVLEGRASEVFKRHGEKVAIPMLLGTIHHVWNGEAVFYRETDSMGEEGHVLVLSPPPPEDAVRSILREFRGTYSRAQWPLRIESVNQLPLLPNGKPNLAEVRGAEEKSVHWSQMI